jgi:hypothetical protein
VNFRRPSTRARKVDDFVDSPRVECGLEEMLMSMRVLVASNLTADKTSITDTSLKKLSRATGTVIREMPRSPENIF